MIFINIFFTPSCLCELLIHLNVLVMCDTKSFCSETSPFSCIVCHCFLSSVVVVSVAFKGE